MRNPLRNQKGLTLVEVLAVIVIGGILILLISNTHIFGQKQYKDQSKKAASLYDVTYAAKVITKEIRKAEKVSVNEDGNRLTLNETENKVITFEQQDDKILKNGNRIVTDISKFEISLDSRKLILKIESLEGPNGKKEKIETEIYIRVGVISESVAEN